MGSNKGVTSQALLNLIDMFYRRRNSGSHSNDPPAVSLNQATGSVRLRLRHHKILKTSVGFSQAQRRGVVDINDTHEYLHIWKTHKTKMEKKKNQINKEWVLVLAYREMVCFEQRGSECETERAEQFLVSTELINYQTKKQYVTETSYREECWLGLQCTHSLFLFVLMRSTRLRAWDCVCERQRQCMTVYDVCFVAESIGGSRWVRPMGFLGV